MTSLCVVGPNLRAPETFHVHHAGCADLMRSHAYGREHIYDITHPQEYATVKEVVDSIYLDGGSFYEESGYVPGTPEYDAAWRDYVGDFKFFPCVGPLPEE